MTATTSTGASTPPVTTGQGATATGDNGNKPAELTEAEKLELARRAAAEAELQERLTELIKSLLPTPISANAQGAMLKTPFGVPGIAPPKGASILEIFDFGAQLTTKSQQTQLNATRDQIVINKNTSEEYHVRLQRMREERDRQMQAATQNDNTSKFLKFFKKNLPYVMTALSVVATVATAGAASPLLVAATVAMTSYQLAQQISQDVGGPSLSMADAMSQGFSEAAQKWGGMSREDADKLGETLSGAVMVAATLASAKSLASGAGVSSLLKMAKDNPAMRSALYRFVAPRLVAPALMALDPKFGANMVSGSARLDGRMSDEDASILNTSVATGLQLAVGVGMGRASGGLGTATKALGAADEVSNASQAAVNSSKFAAGVSVSQATVTTGNGAVGVTDSILSLETEELNRLAAQLGVSVDELVATLDALQQYFQFFAEALQKIIQQMDGTAQTLSDEIHKAHETNTVVAQNIAA